MQTTANDDGPMIKLPDHVARALASQDQQRQRRNMTWQSVQEHVLSRIQDGIWPEGSLIPTEAELALEFGCARATVNRALQALADIGVLERRRKVGTRVAPQPRVQMVRFLLRREIEAAGKVYGYRLLAYDRVSPPADVAPSMLLRVDDSVIRTRATFTADGKPYCCETRWLNDFATPGLTREALENLSPCEWLLGHVAISRAALSMGAAAADDPFIVDALGLEPGAPVLLVERIDWVHNLPVSMTRRYFPPSHRFHADL